MISERLEFCQIFLFVFEGDIKTQNFKNSHDSKNLLFKNFLSILLKVRTKLFKIFLSILLKVRIKLFKNFLSILLKVRTKSLHQKKIHASRRIITGLVGI